MIRAIIFDYGNVISCVNTGDCAAAMEAMTGVPACIFRGVYDKYRSDFDRGYITGTKMYERALINAGYPDIAHNTPLMEKISKLDMESWRAVRKEVVDWGLSIKKSGYLLGILSNMPTEFLLYYRKENVIFNAANYCSFSCECHYIKPERGIYEDCLRGLGIEACQGVFFDDLIENVKAAKAIGLHSYLWQGLEQAKKDWESALRL